MSLLFSKCLYTKQIVHFQKKNIVFLYERSVRRWRYMYAIHGNTHCCKFKFSFFLYDWYFCSMMKREFLSVCSLYFLVAIPSYSMVIRSFSTANLSLLISTSVSSYDTVCSDHLLRPLNRM